MNTLELRTYTPESSGWPAVQVLIDGRDLRDLIRVLETAHAVAGGQPELAGSYEGIPPAEWSDPLADESGRVAVLGCTCGETGCWPLFVRLAVKAGRVVWSDFKGPMSKMVYEELGPFTFAREQYDAAVAAVAPPPG